MQHLKNNPKVNKDRKRNKTLLKRKKPKIIKIKLKKGPNFQKKHRKKIKPR